MNADHADAQVLYCRNLLGLDDITTATMSSVDRYGFDMVAEGPSGRVAVRLGFPEPCDDGLTVRQAMVALVAEARRARPRSEAFTSDLYAAERGLTRSPASRTDLDAGSRGRSARPAT